MEARIRDPASIRRLLTLVDDACTGGLSSKTTAESLKRAVSTGSLSSREIAEHTVSLLLGEADQLGAFSPRSTAATPTAAAHRDLRNLHRQPAASEDLERNSCAHDLVAAWSVFASLARGLTTRPWAEVERAFLEADSREAAEIRDMVVQASPGLEARGNSSSWLLDINQNALERQLDPTSTYNAIMSAWHRWCECSKRVGGLAAAQKLLTDMVGRQRQDDLGSNYWSTGSYNSFDCSPTSQQTSSPNAQQLRTMTISVGQDSPRDRVSSLVTPRGSGLSLHGVTHGATRGQPMLHRKSTGARPRQPAQTRFAPKADASGSPTLVVRTPRHPRSQARQDSHAHPAAQSQRTGGDVSFDPSRETRSVAPVESKIENLQRRPRDEAYSSTPVEEAEPPLVADEYISSSTSKCDIKSEPKVVSRRVSATRVNSSQLESDSNAKDESDDSDSSSDNSDEDDSTNNGAPADTSAGDSDSDDDRDNDSDDDSSDDEKEGVNSGQLESKMTGDNAKDESDDSDCSSDNSDEDDSTNNGAPADKSAGDSDSDDDSDAPKAAVEVGNATTEGLVSSSHLIHRSTEQRKVSLPTKRGHAHCDETCNLAACPHLNYHNLTSIRCAPMLNECLIVRWVVIDALAETG